VKTQTTRYAITATVMARRKSRIQWRMCRSWHAARAEATPVR
jgi:hypothetical protein